MRWDATKTGGFTTGDPWLPMADSGRNVADLQNDAHSILQLYRNLLRIRRQTPALHSGDYAPIRSRDDILIYQRYTEEERLTIGLNISHEARRLPLPGQGTIILSTHLDRSQCQVAEAVILRPDEGMIIQSGWSSAGSLPDRAPR